MEEPALACEVVGCGHVYCRACLLRVRERGYYSCPTCRGKVSGVLPIHHRIDATIDFGCRYHAGITIQSAKDGVRILRAKAGDGAHQSGLRKGHVILEMNGLPVLDHQEAMQIFEAAQGERGMVHIMRRRPWRWWTKNLSHNTNEEA